MAFTSPALSCAAPTVSPLPPLLSLSHYVRNTGDSCHYALLFIFSVTFHLQTISFAELLLLS